MLSEQSKLRDEIRKHYDVESRRKKVNVDSLVQKLSTLNSALKHDIHEVTELKHKVAQELKHAEVRVPRRRLFLSLSISLNPFSFSLCLSHYLSLSIYPSIYLSIYLSVNISMCVMRHWVECLHSPPAATRAQIAEGNMSRMDADGPGTAAQQQAAAQNASAALPPLLPASSSSMLQENLYLPSQYHWLKYQEFCERMTWLRQRIDEVSDYLASQSDLLQRQNYSAAVAAGFDADLGGAFFFFFSFLFFLPLLFLLFFFGGFGALLCLFLLFLVVFISLLPLLISLWDENSRFSTAAGRGGGERATNGARDFA
jgi:hypothetical protein